MFNFDGGAKRLAMDDARTARFTAANDLVRRTLAQHGLLTGHGSGGVTAARPATPDIGSLLDGLGSPHRNMPIVEARLPQGSEFRHDVFACAEGSRAYRSYVPSTASEGVTGLVMMLHGCTQTPEDFAAGTGMNMLAEERGCVVVYPHQSRGASAQSCWNWFRRGDQRRDRGEPAILAGIARKVGSDHRVPIGRIYVAGLSAGAAMAVILGESYPDIFAAVGAHSGLPFAAAKDVPSAFAAMAGRGVQPGNASTEGVVVPTIIFHGSADSTVHPSNSDRIAQDVAARGAGQLVETEMVGQSSGRTFRQTLSANMDGAPLLEHWTVEGLGHAWSGGQPGGSYTDAAGPNASAEMIRFFYDVAAEQSR